MTTSASTIVVHVPLKFTVRGGRKTIIGNFTQTATRTRFDDSIINAIAKAYRWRTLIEDGAYDSITDLARAKRINRSYACRLLRLTALSPEIIEALLTRRGSDLTLKDLMKPFPAVWDEQKVFLRMA